MINFYRHKAKGFSIERPVPRSSALLIAGACLWMLVLMAPASKASTEGNLEGAEFDGVTAIFTLTRSRIRADQKLKVHWVFHNRGEKTTIFRFYEPSIDARLYAKGEKLGDLCPTADNPVFSVTLKPGGRFECTDELFITRCYALAPGRYSIRFNYNLRLLADKSLWAKYDEKYGHPYAGVVAWDGRDHPFTVVK